MAALRTRAEGRQAPGRSVESMAARTPGVTAPGMRARRWLGRVPRYCRRPRGRRTHRQLPVCARLPALRDRELLQLLHVQSAFAAVVTLAVAAGFALYAARPAVARHPPHDGHGVSARLGHRLRRDRRQASTRDYRIDVPWSDTLLHFVVPALAAHRVDDRRIMAVNPPVPWSTVGWVLVYPSIWLSYTLLRGADVGWYPYFFLDEAQVGGPLGVTAYCALVLVIFVAITAALVAVNRALWRRARGRRGSPTGTPNRRAPRAAAPASPR